MNRRERDRTRGQGPGDGAGPSEGAHPTVFVVDDDASFNASLERLLRASGYPVACFQSAADFLSRRPPGAPGCVVVDLHMPGMDGLSLQRALTQSPDPLPIVFLTGHGDIPTSVRAMRLGAEDFLTKTAPSEQLLAAIGNALARDARERLERSRDSERQARFSRLTPREREVLAHVLTGRLNKQIAADLGVDERSVKRHRTSLLAKLGVGSVAALVQLAVEAGIVARDLPPSEG